ncbi:hypothetical protein CDAR_20031 [Caerostris darwini]|uniref:Uncharacterized protein n=1 Tax=Caerostris darwini TaxID=1538125 RepID=A0AAV4SV00_9ARAC|nr:hypothetical protein CDAR_20031 [Caerostris darwini]
MFFVPSLQHMAYSKITVALCNQTDMKAPFNELKTVIMVVCPKDLLDIILAIVERAKQKINYLRIPEMLKPDLIIVLKSTVLLINDWFIDHSDILEPDFDDVSSFHWRSECSIDTVKTAQALVRREDAPVTMRLKFATRYCLEEDVRRLRTMRRTSASSYYLEKDLLRLERRCPLAMLCIRAELCYSMSTDWMRDWCEYQGIHNCRSVGSLSISIGLQ